MDNGLGFHFHLILIAIIIFSIFLGTIIGYYFSNSLNQETLNDICFNITGINMNGSVQYGKLICEKIEEIEELNIIIKDGR